MAKSGMSLRSIGPPGAFSPIEPSLRRGYGSRPRERLCRSQQERGTGPDGERIAFQSQPHARSPLIDVFDTSTGQATALSATQIAGFEHDESLAFFGTPPPGYTLLIEPMAVSVAQARYLERYQLLAEAAGYAPAAQAFDTE